MEFLKGHGTGNDFVLLPDLEGELDLTDELCERLCDRRTGLGADGILRIVPAARAGEPVAPGATWFMDHRNADGSRPEMCGNGIRLFAHYLVVAGLEKPGTFAVATRGGVKDLVVGDGQVTVDMGVARPGDPVLVDGAIATFVDMGNPHAVVAVAALPTGTLDPDRKDLNVEYAARIGPRHLTMRVHERGVGETQSCGTGACAVVVADSLAGGVPRGVPVDVDVPGGRLVVTWQADGHVLLRGPAVIVARGAVEPAWLHPV
ncbi:MAG: diaminopimelate epimerase [Frankiales bacterium]|nr:diaminopimelate epimerase [Frankiales bacterium]